MRLKGLVEVSICGTCQLLSLFALSVFLGLRSCGCYSLKAEFQEVRPATEPGSLTPLRASVSATDRGNSGRASSILSAAECSPILNWRKLTQAQEGRQRLWGRLSRTTVCRSSHTTP
ncbi:hypothetical protein LZ31DRAFT_254670 [Colletotrichum somersetense]|nr:hypothetical protein LZ31DRAFT_254670 [Colletotrichum somersetense]